ncbi:MAG: hypothetical protein ACP5O1_08040 [Phycisphaerae bacterium]
MNTDELTFCLRLAGILHLGLICAGLTMPRAVSLRQHLAPLPIFVRRLFWVYYTFIGLCLVGFGSLTFIFAPQLAAGGGLARALCGFLALFWLLRLAVALFVLDVRPYLTSGRLRTGYHATNIVFSLLPTVYAWAALRP